MKKSAFPIIGIFCVALFQSLEVSAAAESPSRFSGAFVEGEGEVQMLESLDAAFESLRPSARMATIPLTYKRDWNGLGEGSWWPGWWSQNAFGAAYAMQPFMGEEPYASWMANAYDLYFRMMGDGKTKYWPPGSVPPDGALADSAWIYMSGGTANGFGDLRATIKASPVSNEINGKAITVLSGFKQGDGRMGISDWSVGSCAATFIVECDRVLMRRDPANSRERLAQFKRAAAFLDSRRDPETNLLKAGHNSNLLAPSFRGVKKPDGTFEFGFLTEISVLYVAGLERLAEVCLMCGDAEAAKGYRATAQKVREGLKRLMEPEGYFIRSEESDGRHGVFGATKHGYFEAHPNHDAGAMRVNDDAGNARIVDFMLNKVKGSAPPGSLVPNGMVIANYPGYDDHSGEGSMFFGRWNNGGVWPQHQGLMDIACFRAGEYKHPFAAWAAMRPLAEAFRNDSPLEQWGKMPWANQRARPFCFCFDAWGPPAGLLRGLFEYGYEAKGLRLWPHVPPEITRYVQKIPASFGKTKIYIASTGTGPIKQALVSGKSIKPGSDGSFFLPLDGAAKTVTVEVLRGDAKERGVSVAAIPDAFPPASDTAFWKSVPADFVAARDFLAVMRKAGKGETFEAGQAHVGIEVLASAHERSSLAAAGKLRVPDVSKSHNIPAADAAKVDQRYRDQARWIIGGLQDHLRRVSFQKFPVSAETLNAARATGLIP